MTYRRCGQSGIRLPELSLMLCHNFGGNAPTDDQQTMYQSFHHICITHFDLANNYGLPPGSAERNFGQILKEDLARYRNELIISFKAGYSMLDDRSSL